MEDKKLRSLKLKLSAIISRDGIREPLLIDTTYYTQRLEEEYDEYASDTDINEAVSGLLIKEEDSVVNYPDDFYEGF